MQLTCKVNTYTALLLHYCTQTCSRLNLSKDFIYSFPDYADIHERVIYEAKLISKKYLTDRVLLLTLDFDNNNFTLDPGDHLAIFPWNPAGAVHRVKKALKLSQGEGISGHLVKHGGNKRITVVL